MTSRLSPASAGGKEAAAPDLPQLSLTSNCGQAALRAVVKTPCRSHSPVSARTDP